ncbi:MULTISPECIES: SDR family oxidoreductase [Phyllobacterium]|jgi:NAD(P)-dependent dehydrogenase (short-subunit alcohol dehydrogenase family)|uniref:Short-chain dehydrogenase n=1 Tax=Phyllobacterium sophorae TaxID=1520277 RepID=A0A2P7B4I7_9HYPH|nr:MULTISPECIES: SDR family oxidoreductase [Phyllobacterium]PSH61376.1 short-chain dehydrogenase [Phyllobacterium sophorae]UXN63418.1 SDR family oxidoreductase [Phyllobacterium sp. A18/5-2]
MDILKEKTAIVTGASSGIGYETARLFASEGANVIVGARRQSELEKLVTLIESDGGKAAALAGDVRDEAYAKSLVELAESRFGGLDIAFNNAGANGEMGPTSGVSIEGWREALDVNLTGAFLGAKYQIPAMQRRGGGSLIFTSTFVGHTVGMPGTAAYAASKAGVIGLMKTLAAELGPQGIRVNAILPGGTATAMAEAWVDTPEKLAFVEGLHALKRRAAPEEIARSVLYLASDAASFTTGSAMLVDGGVSINRT